MFGLPSQRAFSPEERLAQILPRFENSIGQPATWTEVCPRCLRYRGWKRLVPLSPSDQGPIVRVCLGWRNSAREPLRSNAIPIRFSIAAVAGWQTRSAKHGELTLVQAKGELALLGARTERLLTYSDLGPRVADNPRCHDVERRSSGQ